VSQSTQGSKTSVDNSLPSTTSNVAEEEGEEDLLYKTIWIEARCADRGVLDSYEKFVSMTAKYLNINISRM